jgi:hypothetical protein
MCEIGEPDATLEPKEPEEIDNATIYEALAPASFDGGGSFAGAVAFVWGFHLTTALISNFSKAFATASGRKRTARPSFSTGIRRSAIHWPTVRRLTW